MGYGPLVRAATGVTRLWASERAPGASARHPFFDATTIFPDHVVGRITAIGALAALIRRHRSGCGARVHVSQAEAVINQLDTRYVTLAAQARHGHVVEAPRSHLVLSCRGDDEWCVVSLTTEADRRAVSELVGAADLDPVDALTGWARAHTPEEAAERLQAAGVPAGPMYRADDLLLDPQLRSRQVLVEMAHPCFEVALPCESGPAPYRNIPPAPQRPAPLPGADTRLVCRDILEMGTAEIDRLMADGVLFAAAENTDTPGVLQ